MGEKLVVDLAFGWHLCGGIWSTHLEWFGAACWDTHVVTTQAKGRMEGYDGVLHSCNVYLRKCPKAQSDVRRTIIRHSLRSPKMEMYLHSCNGSAHRSNALTVEELLRLPALLYYRFGGLTPEPNRGRD